jgi:hypothetical protein
MNDDVVTQDDRKSLLAAFARSSEKTESTAMVTMSPPSPMERVIGAQAVAVRRDKQRVLEEIKVLAAAAGENWYYRYPVKSKGGTEWIEGPSIKLANDLAREYGNCDIDTRVTDLGDSWLIYGRFTDYESGFSMTRPFQQRKSQRGMRTDDARGLDIALQIGTSKAIRNVVCNSLQTFADFAFEEARNALVQKIGRNLEGSRQRAIENVANKHIDLQRVERVIGRAGKSWTAPDVAKVVAMLRSIDDGMTIIEDAFPPLDSTPVSQPDDTRTGDGGGGSEQSIEGVDPVTGEVAATQSAATSSDDPAAAADLITAYQRGKADKAKGTQRRAMPGEYRDQTHTRHGLCWIAGYDGEPMPTFATRESS